MPPPSLESLSFPQTGLESVADPGKGPGVPAPLIFRPKLRPEGLKKVFWRPASPYLKVWMTTPPPFNVKGWIRNWECLIKTTLDLIWTDFCKDGFDRCGHVWAQIILFANSWNSPQWTVVAKSVMLNVPWNYWWQCYCFNVGNPEHCELFGISSSYWKHSIFPKKSRNKFSSYQRPSACSLW